MSVLNIRSKNMQETKIEIREGNQEEWGNLDVLEGRDSL